MSCSCVAVSINLQLAGVEQPKVAAEGDCSRQDRFALGTLGL